jgi:pimeloyl-ACP methyl ester carboxylesterase
VVFYDQLGCGRSDQPDDPSRWVIGRFTREVDTVRASLGLDRVHLLGHSWGGWRALEYLATSPQGIATLVLASTSASSAQFAAECTALRASLPDDVQEVSPNLAQREAWNGGESVHYVDHADRYDRQLAPVTDALLERAAIHPQETVVDTGCGCGALTLAAARSAHRAVGVDISEPLVAVAAERARAAGVANAEFLVADAQTHDFGEASSDVVVAQFGLMFFEDPVGAFANLRRALVPGGRLVSTTWQPLGANAWLAPVVRSVARYAAVPDLGGLAGGPGMFALRDDTEIAGLLDSAGYSEVTVDAISPALVVGGGGSVDDAADFLLGMGIVRGLLSRVEDEERASAIEDIRADLARHHEPGVGVRLDAGVWVVSART